MKHLYFQSLKTFAPPKKKVRLHNYNTIQYSTLSTLPWWEFSVTMRLRAWLHGEFQPGLKFRSAHRAEILLRLHGQFQPGRKTLISVRKFTEVQKHNRYACSRSFFSPGWKNDSDYMDFLARLAGLKILARFENTGLGFSARSELRPGLNPSPCNRQLGFLRICFRSPANRAEISHHVIGP